MFIALQQVSISELMKQCDMHKTGTFAITSAIMRTCHDRTVAMVTTPHLLQELYEITVSASLYNHMKNATKIEQKIILIARTSHT